MKRSFTTRILARKRELTSAFSAVGIMIIYIFILAILVYNFIPRAGDILSIYGSGDNFQKLRDEIAEATQLKLQHEKSMYIVDDKFKSRDKNKYYQEIISEAKSNHLKILSFEETGSATEDDIIKSTVIVEMSGLYSGLTAFIKRLETDIVPVSVGSLKISTPNSVTTELRCEIALSIYRDANE